MTAVALLTFMGYLIGIPVVVALYAWAQLRFQGRLEAWAQAHPRVERRRARGGN
ncbi:hypothetical protein MINTM005_13880 [Mycobacterium intracellulare]|uniref:hypothetical protein n=1 Tax=Mycobacterium intracellulare TaxID=1767 RepID=UPI001926EAD2|nr:hypothetical protein [Mycobacterium intracellulare]BCO56144.1 hypothetical protein MINTM005_13880 [Mycobacterium intracellulare]